MRPHLVATLACLTIPATAQADIRATYTDGSVVEINDDGAMRGNVLSEGKWLLHSDRADYLLVAGGAEVKVLDATVVEQVEIDDANFAIPGRPLDFFATEELMLRLGLIEVS